jgi:GNAT superfamily N-acetyltransferase
MRDYQIRKAKNDDIAKLGDIEHAAAQVFTGVGLQWLADGDNVKVDELFDTCNAGTLWVAVGGDDEPMGFLAGHVLEEFLYIAEISVAPNCQRKGLSRALILAAEGFAVEKKLHGLSLTTYTHLSWNAPYYRKLGFVVVESDAVGPRLLEKLAVEIASGHDPSHRCVMQKFFRHCC